MQPFGDSNEPKKNEFPRNGQAVSEEIRLTISHMGAFELHSMVKDHYEL